MRVGRIGVAIAAVAVVAVRGVAPFCAYASTLNAAIATARTGR